MAMEDKKSEESVVVGAQAAHDGMEVDPVDIEVFAKEKKHPPKGRRYRIRVDKTYYEVAVSKMTGAEILHLASKTPDKWLLRQKVHGQMLPVGPAEEVDFTKPGVERFATIPNEVTEGDATDGRKILRREFQLLDEDLEYLESLDLSWEAVVEGGVRRVVIRGFTVPPGYNESVVDMFVIIPDGYPDAQLDMAYFSPPLARGDRRHINNLLEHSFEGSMWQGWSRHRTPNSQWRMGIDNLSTHMALVSDFLQRELMK